MSKRKRNPAPPPDGPFALTAPEPDVGKARGEWVGLDDPRPVVVSWGAGVQSKTIGLLVERGELPRPAAWVFADTGAEPAAIYRDVERWAPRLEALGGLHVVKHPKETLTEHLARGGDKRIPMWLEGPNGVRQPMMWRACTGEWKIKPIERWIRARFGALEAVVQWMGISVDEAQRAKPNGRTAYPLLETKRSRAACHRLLVEAGEPLTRSACVFCPYRGNSEWAALTDDEVERAGVAEDGVRASFVPRPGQPPSPPSLHRSGIPIRERPWEAVGGEQTDLSAGDCGGSCFT